MTLCLEVWRHLEAGAVEFPEELQPHLEECDACRTLVAFWPHVAAAGQLVQLTAAPPQLVAKLVALPRLPWGCEQAVEAASCLLEEPDAAVDRGGLLEHLHQCPSCRGFWEACATLRQVGQKTHASASLAARLTQIPHQAQPAALPGQRPWRLAAAAAYILAGTLVLLAGSPEHLTGKAVSRVEEVAFYAQAAAANRFRWLKREVGELLSATEQWARESVDRLGEQLKGGLGRGNENSKKRKGVLPKEEGAQS